MTGLYSRTVWCLATLLVLSCSTGGEDYSLRGDEAERLERRRSRMNVRVRDANGAIEEMTPEAFMGVVEADCVAAAGALTQLPCTLPSSGDPDLNNSCQAAACISTAALCVANRYLELGAAIDPVDVGSYVVPPQSNATRAGFYEMATYLTSVALNVAGEALRTPYVIEGFLAGKAPTPGCTKDDLALGSSDPEIRMADILVGNVAESTMLVREAAGNAVRANVAHADAEPARTPDRVLATRAGWHDPFLSRGRAAQLLFGDVNPSSGNQTSIPYGLPNSCELPRLTQRGRQALGYVRSSGISPAAVRSDDPIDLFLNDQDGVIPRLQTLLDLPDLEAGNEIESFLAAHHVSEADFVEARAHLRCQLDAFPRDETESEMRLGILVYRATELEPRRHRGEAQWAEMLASEAHLQIVGSQESPPRDSHEPMRGAAYALDYARKLTVELTSMEVSQTPPELVTTTQRDFIGSVASETSMTSGPDITSCVYEASTGVLGVRVIVDDDGTVPESAYIIAGGAQTLECAILGSIDGEECTLSPPGLRQPSVGSSSPPTSTGYTRRLTFTYTVNSIPTYGLRDFVLKRRPGLGGTPPGGYEVVAPAVGAPSASMTTLNVGEQLCDHVPSGTGLDDDAEASLSVAPTERTVPDVGCEEMPTLPVALEGELTDDGDRYETSWRRQLEIARVAAEQADALGSEMISEGSSIDARAETAQAEIERLCGVSVDLTGLFDDQLTDATAGACSGAGTCASGYRCVGEACVLDPIARIQASVDDSRTQRILGECLGYAEGSVHPLVALGTTELCVWRDADDVSVVCDPDAVLPVDPADGPHPCPFQMLDGACTLWPGYQSVDADMDSLPDHPLVAVDTNLGFFEEDSDGEGTTGGGTPDPTFDCGHALRGLRTNPQPILVRHQQIARQIVESGRLSRDEVHAAAERIGWRGEPGDYSAITLDGAPVFSTGDPYASTASERPGTGWPCAPRTPAISLCAPVGATSTALFCQTWDCTDRRARAEANYRMARAAATLGIISGFGMTNVDVPIAIPHRRPSIDSSSPGVNERPWVGYLDEGSVAAELTQTNSPAWSGMGDATFSGRAYYSAPGGGGLIWTGHAEGADIASAAVFNGTNPNCIDGWCDIRLSSLRDEAGRYVAWFAFARMGDGFWTTDERARAAWLSAIWAGMDYRTSSSGVVKQTLQLPYRAGRLFDTLRTDGATVSPNVADQTRIVGPPMAAFELGSDTYGNYARLFDHGAATVTGITHENVLDALELACYSSSPQGMVRQCRDLPAPSLASEADIPAARQYLSCLAGSIEQASERMLAQNLPRIVVSGMRGEAAATSPLEGQFGTAASGARETLLMLREQPSAIAAQVRGFEGDLGFYEIAIRQAAIRRETIDWRSAQQAISAAATCAEIAENSAGGRFGGGIARCGAALANLAISFRISDLERESVGLDEGRALIEAQGRMEGRIDALQGIEAHISRLLNQLGGHLATLNATQGSARSALGTAMMTSSVPGREHLGELPHVAPLNTVMRRRYTTARQRYDAALWRARRAAVLARRSMEQRLGMSVRDMNDLALVRDPTSLDVASCELGGLDYSRIRDEGWTSTDPSARDSYADGFIGDYVRDLQAVWDSYSYRYPYTDGTDTAVVSVRDDLMALRRECDVPSYNLLRGTNSLDGMAWDEVDCLAGDPAELCIGVRPLDTRDVVMGDTWAGPLADRLDYLEPAAQAPAAFELSFGTTRVQSSTRLEQSLAPHGPGTHRLSWYAREVGAGMIGSSAVQVAGDVSLVGSVLDATGSQPLATGWARYVVYFDASGGDIQVSIDAGSNPAGFVQIAGLMLEEVTHLGPVASIDAAALASSPTVYLPRLYQGTNDSGLVGMPSCEDTHGVAFRASTDWARRCDMLCSNGLFGECPPGEIPQPRCYWELPLSFERDAIVAGQQFGGAGFAHGNFNYRIERIGVNVVGTASRTCDDAAFPSTCYASGWVPFSLHHLPPYDVINHEGVLYSTPLFTGTIETARALAAERYLTNPMSGADRSLIDPYMRDDFHGRPLSGRMNLRIWDVPGVDFNGIEDIQLVIDYRYWNRSRAPDTAE